jgi:hypothetical protein
MTYSDKEFGVQIVSFWMLMLAILSEWVFGWPTNQHLLYISIAWLIFTCAISLYGWHLEHKE